MNGTTKDLLSNQKLASSLLIMAHSIFVLLPSLTLNIAIFLTFLLGKNLHNPLTVLYGTVVGTAIVNSVTRLLTTPIYVSKMVLQCSCQAYLMEQIFSAVVHHFFYPIILAAIGIVQLVIPMYRYRRIVISYVTITTVVTVVLVLAVPLSFLLLALTDMLSICTEICLAGAFPTSQYGQLLGVLLPVQALSLAVTAVCYIRSMSHYESMTIHESRISRKVAAFPILMSTWIAVQALLHLIPFALASDWESSTTSPHWSMLVLNIPFFFMDVTGLTLPILLLVLSNKTRDNLQLLLQKYYGRSLLFFNFAVLPVFWNAYRRYTAQVHPAQQFPQASSQETDTSTACSQLTES